MINNHAIVRIISLLFIILSMGCENPEEADNIPPTVVITNPTSGIVLEEPITIKVEASDNKTVTVVKFLIDSIQIGEDYTKPYEQDWNVFYWADGGLHIVSVKAEDESGNISLPDLVSVTVSEEATASPPLISPFNQQIIRDTNQVNLTWHRLPDANEYEVTISSKSDFSEVVFSSITLDTSIYTPILVQGIHYWRVRSDNAIGLQSSWSPSRIFEIDGPIPPILISPFNDSLLINIDTPIFVWNNTPHAESYEINVSSLNDFSTIELNTTTEDTTFASKRFDNGSHYWRVRGRNSVGIFGEWSNVDKFVLSNTIVFSKVFGSGSNDRGQSVQPTLDGGYIVVGYVAGGVWLIKTNEFGTIEWDKTFSGFQQDRGFSVQQTTDQGYIITGYSTSFGNGSNDVWLIKTDIFGNEEWNKIFGGISDDRGHSVRQTSDGGFILTGTTQENNGSSDDLYIIKTNSSGNEQWSKKYGGLNNAFGNSIREVTDGGYIVTGYYSGKIWLLKVNSQGNEEWNKTFADGQGYSVQQTSDGGYIVAASSRIISGIENTNAILIKTNALGDKEWENIFDGNNWDEGRSVQQTSDGGYILVGTTQSFGAGFTDAWLIKTDVLGNVEWNKTYGESDDDRGYSVHQTSDGGYIIAGYTKSFGAINEDVWLFKTDSDGNSSF